LTTGCYTDQVIASAKKLLDEALRLSDDERMELVTALSDSFEPTAAELSPQWRHEVEDRIGQVERGEVEPVGWEQVEARIRATLAAR
jgi:putative addiction module component (TIGR02574 family)